MATVLFYEKPGCGNNTKQKVLLAAAGHTVQARSLLTEKWTAERLRGFFADLPLAQWFNPAAPRVKSGEIDPSGLDEATAIELMLADPLLIRRPLMEVGEERRVGFNPEEVDAWIGLKSPALIGDVESCPKSHLAQPCAVPATSP
jgi:nitrogenase-associated protein